MEVAKKRLGADIPRCKPDGATAQEDDIVVCTGRSPYALPLPGERAPAEGPRRATGDVPAATATIPKPCPIQGCGNVDVIKVGGFIFKLLKTVVEGED